jgi:hypothetical protein
MDSLYICYITYITISCYYNINIQHWKIILSHICYITFYNKYQCYSNINIQQWQLILLHMCRITNINFTRYQHPTMETDVVTTLLYNVI